MNIAQLIYYSNIRFATAGHFYFRALEKFEIIDETILEYDFVPMFDRRTSEPRRPDLFNRFSNSRTGIVNDRHILFSIFLFFSS